MALEKWRFLELLKNPRLIVLQIHDSFLSTLLSGLDFT